MTCYRSKRSQSSIWSMVRLIRNAMTNATEKRSNRSEHNGERQELAPNAPIAMTNAPCIIKGACELRIVNRNRMIVSYSYAAWLLISRRL